MGPIKRPLPSVLPLHHPATSFLSLNLQQNEATVTISLPNVHVVHARNTRLLHRHALEWIRFLSGNFPSKSALPQRFPTGNWSLSWGMQEGSQSGSNSDHIADSLNNCADTDKLRRPDSKTRQGQQRSDSCHAWGPARPRSGVDCYGDSKLRCMKPCCCDQQGRQEDQRDQGKPASGPSSSSHGQATADTLRASSSTPQQTAPSSNTPPAARTNPNQQQQQHANVLQYLGLSCSHSYWLPLPLSSLSLTPTFGSTVPGLPSVSTAVEDAEDEMSQVYSEWGQVCPASTVPLLSTHASTPSCSRGSGAAVVWAPLGSLQQDGEVPRTVYPGAHSGIPVQLDLTATEEGVVAQVAWLPAGAQAQAVAGQGQQQPQMQAQQQQPHQQQLDPQQQAQQQQQPVHDTEQQQGQGREPAQGQQQQQKPQQLQPP